MNFLTLNLVNFYYLPLTLTQDLYSYQTFLKAVNWYKRVALNCMVLEFVIYLVTMVMIKIQFFLFHMYIAMANCYSVIIMYKQEEETLASICTVYPYMQLIINCCMIFDCFAVLEDTKIPIWQLN